jgi:DNA-binding FadR family transcriptional regulator
MKSLPNSRAGETVTSAPIRVNIFDHSKNEHCSRYCGLAWSLEDVAFIAEHLRRKYDDGVEYRAIMEAIEAQTEVIGQCQRL